MFYLFSKRGRASRAAAKQLYHDVVVQSRNPVFYSDYNVPDTFEGRFDMMCLHGGLLVSRLCRPDMGVEGRRLAQAYFDVMFQSVDLNIREMGVGDLAVPRRIKRLMSNFKGRAFAYDEACKSGMSDIVHALARNIYAANANPGESTLDALARYVQVYYTNLDTQTPQDFWNGHINFPALSQPSFTLNRQMHNAHEAA